MKLFTFALGLVFAACRGNITPKTETIHRPYSDSLKQAIIGQWGALNDPPPVWDITANSIYYFERKAFYPYKIIDSSLKIYLPESIGTLKNINVVKDTMFFWDEAGNLISAFKFRNKIPH